MYEMEGPRPALPRRLPIARPPAAADTAPSAPSRCPLCCRLLGCRLLDTLCATDLRRQHDACDVSRMATTGVRSRRLRQSPGPSGVPLVSLGADPVFSGEEFLLPTECAAQAFSARSSRFFRHPQDIRRLSHVHGRFPPLHAQAVHKLLWIAALAIRYAGLRAIRCPKRNPTGRFLDGGRGRFGAGSGANG
jgi:hypothetical protein